MHDSHTFLANLALVLSVAAVTTVVFQKLKQPVVFGYMLAGLVVGPHIPIPLVADAEFVNELAELGVILLMFSLGLEFNLRRLAQVGGTALFVAVLQSGVMMCLGFAVSRAFGWSTLECVYAGAIIAISSTTIIVKAFADQGVKGPVADIVFGVLIFEDLIAILLLAVLTPVGAGRELSATDTLVTLARLAGFLVASLVIGLFVVPRAVRFVVKLNRPETTLVACVGLCFAGALLAQKLGYSVALGAFLAGALVGESGEKHVVEKLVEPVRDMFGAVFFIAVGMLIDPKLVGEHWVAVVVFTLLVVVGKVTAVTFATFLSGRNPRDSVRAGMSLAQIGEFSFIIAGVGIATGATGAFLYPVAVAVSAATTLLTPWLIRSSDRVSESIDQNLPRPLQTFVSLYGSWIENSRQRPLKPTEDRRVQRAIRVLVIDAVVVLGILIAAAIELEPASAWVEQRLGWGPQAAHASVVAAMALVSAPFCIGMVRTAGTLGQTLASRAFPDPTSPRFDRAAAPRRAMVTAIQLAIVLAVGLPLAALSLPLLAPAYSYVAIGALAAAVVVLGIGFWKSAANLYGHARAGAEVVVAALARQTRVGAEGGATHTHGLSDALAMLPGLGTPEQLLLAASCPAVGASLRDLRLRGRTGASVLAIVRGETTILVPDGHETLQAGDLLALAGTTESVAAARVLLAGAPDPAKA